MANLYMGRGGMDGLFGGGSPMPGPMPQWNPGTGTPIQRPPIVRVNEGAGANPANTPAPSNPNVLGAQSVRATGPSQGYDPSYLQNLATSIGGLFSRPQGNLSFNPLGNLSEISPASGQLGNAPGFGEPSTWLQDALNGIAFMFKQPPTDTTSNPVVNQTRPVVGSGGINRSPRVGVSY